jgi:hypothetical protein
MEGVKPKMLYICEILFHKIKLSKKNKKAILTVNLT